MAGVNDKSPAVQWYPKQYLGDDKVLAMDWDARGMHHWLLNISWQQEPVGSIPDDICTVRRWLGLPSGFADADRVWARVWPQISAAWALKNGRWFNAGMVRAWERQQIYKQNGSKSRAKLKQIAEDEDEVNTQKTKPVKLDWDCKSEPPAGSSPDDIAPILLNQIGIGRSAETVNASIEALRTKGSQPGWTVPKAFVHIYHRALEYKQSKTFNTRFKKSWAKWLIEGDYDQDPRAWNEGITGLAEVDADGGHYEGTTYVTKTGVRMPHYTPPPKPKAKVN